MNDTITTAPAAPIPSQRRTVGSFRRVTLVSTSVAAAVASYLLLPADFDELSRRTVAIFVIAAILWATEALPLYTTSLCVIGLEILLLAEHGGLAPAGGLSYSTFFAPFSSPVVILFMGGFLLSTAISKHQIDRVLAVRLLTPFFKSTRSLVFAVLGVAAFMSMWMSNTAAMAMMLALISPMLHDSSGSQRLKQSLILAACFGANVGGIGTPIGSPPNAVALAALRSAGHMISFLDWMLMAVPLMLLMLLVAGYAIMLVCKPPATPDLHPIEAPPALSFKARSTLILLAAAILAWLTASLHGIDESVIALLAAAVLSAMGLLDRKDVNAIDWDILLLMWGGLSLGVAMQSSGLLDRLTTLPILQTTGIAIAVVMVLVAMTLSIFISNTAAANLLIPLAMALSAEEGGRMAIVVPLAVSLSMLLPISTPPNAIAFASGQVPAGLLFRAALIMAAAGIVTLLLGYRIVLPLVLGL